jgi:hypothetical protein
MKAKKHAMPRLLRLVSGHLPDSASLLPAFMRSATLSFFIAGPLAVSVALKNIR